MAFFTKKLWPPLNRSAGALFENVLYFRLWSGRGARELPNAAKSEARGAAKFSC